jgi:hypothetical protein
MDVADAREAQTWLLIGTLVSHPRCRRYAAEGIIFIRIPWARAHG